MRCALNRLAVLKSGLNCAIYWHKSSCEPDGILQRFTLSLHHCVHTISTIALKLALRLEGRWLNHLFLSWFALTLQEKFDNKSSTQNTNDKS